MALNLALVLNKLVKNQIIYRNDKVSEIKILHKQGENSSETVYFKKGKDFCIKSSKLNHTIKARLIQLPSMVQKIFLAETKKGVEVLKSECSSNFVRKTPAFNTSLINEFVEV
jgi:hypothetical protein